MKQILAILFITATLASCKKSSDDGYYTITGLVLDWDSKAPIAGAKVYAFTSFFNPATNDNAITDANGMVSFRYLNLHQAGIYNATDLMQIRILGYRKALFLLGGNPMTKVDVFFLDRRAMAADSLLNIASVYFNPPYQKAYIDWNVSRNGSIISSGSDSTDLIQFGTKNFNLNY